MLILCNCRFIDENSRKDIIALLQFDSRLLYIIPWICPRKDTSLLCDILPLPLAIVWLVDRLNLKSYSLKLSTLSDSKVITSSHYWYIIYSLYRWNIVSRDQWPVFYKEYMRKK